MDTYNLFRNCAGPRESLHTRRLLGLNSMLHGRVAGGPNLCLSSPAQLSFILAVS